MKMERDNMENKQKLERQAQLLEAQSTKIQNLGGNVRV